MGDPSTAKSQFLKFVEKVAPVGVYTSGKGSSAAGLTASVVQDAKGEFFLEGGAMVLADGGVVCIDEFDKMRETDRVAIHEVAFSWGGNSQAMEQQTISIAKAGITTVLNSRCAVLAAANPIYGRYDDTRSTADNIDFLPSILSRFDLIFIVRDIRDYARDIEMAKNVMNVHLHAGKNTQEEDLPLDFLKRYIAYCPRQVFAAPQPGRLRGAQEPVRADARGDPSPGAELQHHATGAHFRATARGRGANCRSARQNASGARSHRRRRQRGAATLQGLHALRCEERRHLWGRIGWMMISERHAAAGGEATGGHDREHHQVACGSRLAGGAFQGR